MRCEPVSFNWTSSDPHSLGRLGLPRPVDRRVGRVPLSEDVPVLRVPDVIECLHSLEIADGRHDSLSADGIAARPLDDHDRAQARVIVRELERASVQLGNRRYEGEP
jgi:hypothetical protein